MKVATVILHFAFAAVSTAVVCSGSSIVVVPPSHQFRPNLPTGNVSFMCDVNGEDPSAGRDAVWAVQQRQIQNLEVTAIRMNLLA